MKLLFERLKVRYIIASYVVLFYVVFYFEQKEHDKAIILVRFKEYQNKRFVKAYHYKEPQKVFDALYLEFLPVAQQFAPKFNISAKDLCLVMVSQAVLESAWYKSQLAVKYNNIFSHKPRKNDKKVSVYAWEYENNKVVYKDMYFRVYDNLQDALKHHFVSFLLRKRYKGVQRAQSVKGFFEQLYVCGYASDINYSKKLLRIYNKYSNKY